MVKKVTKTVAKRTASSRAAQVDTTVKHDAPGDKKDNDATIPPASKVLTNKNKTSNTKSKKPDAISVEITEKFITRVHMDKLLEIFLLFEAVHHPLTKTEMGKLIDAYVAIHINREHMETGKIDKNVLEVFWYEHQMQLNENKSVPVRWYHHQLFARPVCTMIGYLA